MRGVNNGCPHLFCYRWRRSNSISNPTSASAPNTAHPTGAPLKSMPVGGNAATLLAGAARSGASAELSLAAVTEAAAPLCVAVGAGVSVDTGEVMFVSAAVAVCAESGDVVASGIDVAACVRSGVAVFAAVSVGAGVAVGVLVAGLAAAVATSVTMVGVAVFMGTDVAVCVGCSVAVSVGAAVAVRVLVGGGVAVSVAIGAAVGTLVIVAISTVTGSAAVRTAPRTSILSTVML